MPYQTPSASQFTSTKRLLASIEGSLGAAVSKPRYTGAMPSIRGIPANILRSNKFPVPESLTIDRVIQYISTDTRVPEMAKNVYDYLKENQTKEAYQHVSSKIPATIPLSPTEDLIFPAFGTSDSAIVTPPVPSSGKSHVYMVYPGSSIIIPSVSGDITLSFDGSKYTYTSGATSYILQEDDPIPGLPGIRFKPGSIILKTVTIPFPFSDTPAMPRDQLIWFRGVPLDWEHPDIVNISIPGYSWTTSVSLPDGLSVDPKTGHIVGMVRADPTVLNIPGPNVDAISLIGTDPDGIDRVFPFSIKFIPDLRLIENTYDATLNRDGYQRLNNGTTILVKLNQNVSFRVFDIDPNYPGTSLINPTGNPITWAILPELPIGMYLDSMTGEISGVLKVPLNSEYRIAVRDEEYPWDTTRSKYFILKTVSETIPVSRGLIVSCLVGETKTFDLKRKIDLSEVREPFTCATASTLPASIVLRPDGVIEFNSPNQSDIGQYYIDIDVSDSYNGSRPLSSPVILLIETQTAKNVRDVGILANTINSEVESGIPSSLITQGAAPFTSTYVFYGGGADTTEFNLILDGTR